MVTQRLVQAPSSGPAPGAVVVGGIDLNAHIHDLGGSVLSVRQEVQDAFDDMKTFLQREPDEIMRITSGHSARISELRVKAMRCEDYVRGMKDLRQRELEPLLAELENQWRNASRLHSVRELDWKMESGER